MVKILVENLKCWAKVDSLNFYDYVRYVFLESVTTDTSMQNRLRLRSEVTCIKKTL